LLREAAASLVPLLILAVGEVVAGLTLQFNIGFLAAYQVIMILAPGLMDLRGDVYGAIGYRLTTALHLGEAEPGFFTRFNLVNTLTGLTVSLIASFILGSVGLTLSLLTGLTTMDPISLFFTVVASTLIVFAVLSPATTLSIIALFKKGVDPSGFVAVVVTGIGDALTPLTLITVSLLHEYVPYAVKAVFTGVAAALAAASYIYLARIHEDKPVRENASSSIMAATGSSIGGLVIASSLGFIARVPEVLGVLPAFNALIGASMGHLGNRLNIELHVKGEVSPREYWRSTLAEAIATYSSIIVALLAVSLASGAPLWRLMVSLAIVTLSFAIVYFLSALTTLYLSESSFRHGWDPDNIVFPLMTTFADFNGSLFTSLVTRITLAL